jgi:hypothetical protein
MNGLNNLKTNKIMPSQEIPKQQALILVSTFWNTKVETTHVRESIMSKELAIKCSIYSVEKIIEALDVHQWQNREEIEFYNKVKKELENL